MVVAYPNGPLRVFEQRDAGEPAVPSNLVVSSYTIVLTRAPEETVQVTASVVPISERDRRAGGKGIALCVGTATCTTANRERRRRRAALQQDELVDAADDHRRSRRPTSCPRGRARP